MNRPGNDGWDAVLFDLDGTLADTVALILRCFHHTMEAHLGRTRPDAEWLCNMGRPLRVQLAAFARDAAEADAMLATYVAHQRQHHDGMVAAYPGIAAVLAALAERGSRLAVVTSKGREMAHRTLAAAGLAEWFPLVVTPEDVRRGKPDPEPVLYALRALGEPPPDRVLMVGDSPFDVEAGRGAGVRTAAVLWGPFSRAALEPAAPDFWVAEPDELLALAPAAAAGRTPPAPRGAPEATG
jgi:pyrophosphatase PpaX